MRSKYRKGSLNKSDETYLSLLNQSTVTNQTSSSIGQPTGPGLPGSTALNYSNSTASSGTAVSSQQAYGGAGNSSNSRKSLISNPINFQHLQHMGPNDGKSFMTTDISLVHMQAPLSHNPSMTGSAPASRHMNSTLNNTTSMSDSNPSINNTTSNNGHHHSTNSGGGSNSKKSTSSSGVKQIGKLEISG